MTDEALDFIWLDCMMAFDKGNSERSSSRFGPNGAR